MNRRGFLGAILATACAPAIVRADALMRIVPRATTIVPAAGGYLLPPELRLLTGGIGSYSDVVFFEGDEPAIQMAQMSALVSLIRERQIKPDSNGYYWMDLPREWRPILSGASSR